MYFLRSEAWEGEHENPRRVKGPLPVAIGILGDTAVIYRCNVYLIDGTYNHLSRRITVGSLLATAYYIEENGQGRSEIEFAQIKLKQPEIVF